MRKLTGTLAGVSLLAMAGAAQADQFQYSGESVFDENSVTITEPRSITANVGQIRLTGSGPNAGQTLPVWCIDILHNLAGSDTYAINALTTAGAGGGNPTLTATQISEMGSLMIQGTLDLPLTGTQDPDHLGALASTAFQLAIWQIEYEFELDHAARTPG